jgi:CxxC motif-containing protein
MTKILTCINCPMGCELTVEVENGKVLSVSGNTCKRGELYAESEITAPTRTITTTVISEQGRPVPVKTAQPIPKDKIFECTAAIKALKVSLPVKVGQVLEDDLLGTGSQVTATKSVG